ncbi:MAG: HAMP domain-containing protein [Desulfobacteraceae bacterium]|nr:HAMP domain-containing protein [Desulfobacteraceae bacterium]
MKKVKSSLQIKVILVIFGIFITIGTIDYIIQMYTIYPNYIRLEKKEANTNLLRLKATIDKEISDLNAKCKDSSSWTDTYTYVQDRNQDYEESNLSVEWFEFLQINLHMILNNNNEVVWGKIVDPSFEKEIDLKGFNKEKFTQNHPALQFDPMDKPSEMGLTGILLTEYGPMLIASNPILTSNHKGPSRGTYIMGKLLSETVLEKIISQTQVPFKIILPGDADFADKFLSIKENIDRNDGTYIETLEHHLDLYAYYLDLTLKPAFIIKTQLHREITESGFGALRSSLGTMIITIFIVLVLLHLYLHKSVLQPINLLTHYVLDIKESRDFGSRVSVESSDELGALADHMNDMVSTIGEQTTHLAEANLKLQKSLDEIKTLRGILPICCNCKSIRDDKGYWNKIEAYIQQHSEAEFSHGICQKCAEKLYPDLYPVSDNQRNEK